jgi:hypothetical protein
MRHHRRRCVRIEFAEANEDLADALAATAASG